MISLDRIFPPIVLCLVTGIVSCAADSNSRSGPDAGEQEGDGDGDSRGDRDSGHGHVGDGDGDEGDGDQGDGDTENLDAGQRDGSSASEDGDAAVDMGAFCAPGIYERTFWGSSANHADRCHDQGWLDALEALNGDAKSLSIWNIPLAVPMAAGEPYALSFELNHSTSKGSWGVEIWGTTSECAADGLATKLYSKPAQQGLYRYCVDAMPKAAYTHLLFVLRGEDEAEGVTGLGSATWCASGSCPSK